MDPLDLENQDELDEEGFAVAESFDFEFALDDEGFDDALDDEVDGFETGNLDADTFNEYEVFEWVI